MRITRRRFVAVLALAVVAAGAATVWRRRLALRHWVIQTPLTDSPPGPLRDSTADTLLASVRALLGDGVEPAHYVDFFRWHAEHLPGHRKLYEDFEAHVDRAARRHGHAGFRACPRERQSAILVAMLPASGSERVRRLILARDEARFGKHIVREIFRRFARTDAWVLSGYDAWPGVPRAIAKLRRESRAT